MLQREMARGLAIERASETSLRRIGACSSQGAPLLSMTHIENVLSGHDAQSCISEEIMKGHRHCFALACFLILATAAAVQAQPSNYPVKPVQIIADSSAGSAPDVALRFVADRLGQAWGQQILVVNRPGAGGSVAARAAAEAAPDGYTLYQPVLSTFVSLHPAAPNVPLHVPKDFLPIGFVSENPMFIAVAPSLGISSLPELIERAKKNPGQISYARRMRSATSQPGAST
jgi:tripartite-type tricarboxylate transporter receptor subunit TctC